MGTLGSTECAFIDRHRVAHLATADAHGAPHLVPIVYARVEQELYFIVDEKPKRTRTALKRLRNIAENSQVAFLIDDYDEDWSRLAYLMVRGDATLVTDEEAYARVLIALQTRFPQYASMPLAFDTHPMVCITPRHSYLWRAG